LTKKNSAVLSCNAYLQQSVKSVEVANLNAGLLSEYVKDSLIRKEDLDADVVRILAGLKPEGGPLFTAQVNAPLTLVTPEAATGQATKLCNQLSAQTWVAAVMSLLAEPQIFGSGSEESECWIGIQTESMITWVGYDARK